MITSKHNSNLVSYHDHRQHIKNGDVLLYQGEGGFAWIVSRFFNSPYTHAGIVATWNDRLMVMEAVGKGVIATPLSENLARHKGGVDHFQCTMELPAAKRTRMVQFAQMQLGKEYNLWALLKSGMRVVFQLSLKAKSGEFKHPAGKYFCSQYVSEIYEKAGIDLNIDLKSTRTAPSAIADSPLLKRQCTLKID